MSLIARQRWDGRIILFCKGADSIMLGRVKPGQEIQASVEQHLVGKREGVALEGGLVGVWDCDSSITTTELPARQSVSSFTSGCALCFGHVAHP